jgi:hypothetical protein
MNCQTGNEVLLSKTSTKNNHIMEEFKMKENKNILKGNRHAELKTVRNHSFYATIEVKDKTFVYSYVGNRLEAKRELEAIAKELGGTISYFGGFVK